MDPHFWQIPFLTLTMDKRGTVKRARKRDRMQDAVDHNRRRWRTACRPLNVDNDYRRCSRARPAASSRLPPVNRTFNAESEAESYRAEGTVRHLIDRPLGEALCRGQSPGEPHEVRRGVAPWGTNSPPSGGLECLAGNRRTRLDGQQRFQLANLVSQ